MVGRSEHVTPAPVRVSLPADHIAPARARAIAAPLLADLPPDRAKDVELLISELVTIAVAHSTSPPDQPIVLRISERGGAIRAEVEDAGEGFNGWRTSADDAARGWGLRLLDRMADRWGVERGDGRTLAWFEVAVRAQLGTVR
jgi:anti-sigma regulatory factor (Ser/Thr protein kinase)